MSSDSSIEGTGCQVNELFQILSRAHMLDLLHLFTSEADEPVRFNEIEEALEVSPNTLSKRLKEMGEVGLVERRSYQEIPPRVEYEATEKAMDLLPVFAKLDEWTDEHDLREEIAAQTPS
jgi:DNA-binding HxlR family transcriptional regulator